MDLTTRLTDLIEASFDAKLTYSRLASDRDPHMQLGAPATAAALQALEQHFGRSIPPSYRAFLALHDGWRNFDGDTHLLATGDHREAWVLAKVAELSGLLSEYGDDNPFARGALPILLGPDEGAFAVLDPHRVRKNGEMEIVTFELTAESDRLKDFVAFLEDDLEVTRLLIRDEQDGVEDDEDEDDA